jgi:hypothetical protein
MGYKCMCHFPPFNRKKKTRKKLPSDLWCVNKAYSLQMIPSLLAFYNLALFQLDDAREP